MLQRGVGLTSAQVTLRNFRVQQDGLIEVFDGPVGLAQPAIYKTARVMCLHKVRVQQNSFVEIPDRLLEAAVSGMDGSTVIVRMGGFRVSVDWLVR